MYSARLYEFQSVQCVYLLSGFRFSTAACVWLVFTTDTTCPFGFITEEVTSYSVNQIMYVKN